MLCFNCRTPLSDSDYCSNCGAKVTVYKRIIRMSNTYYNMGLLKANNRDLSGAADILRRSIQLNKKNTKARNLLGLVYFEMGETVAALSQWILSVHFRPERNPANDYLNKLRSNQNRLDELNESVKKFNVALNYAKQGSTDMAVIQLKKVLAQNPKFIKALQLMTLLLIKNGEYDRARKILKRALSVDKCNSLSLKYQRELDLLTNKNTETERNPEVQERKPLSGNDVILPTHFFREHPNGAVTILNIVIGLIIGALCVYFVVTPIKVNNQLEENKKQVLENNQKLAIKNSSLDELQRQVDDLTSEKKDLQADVEKYKSGNNSIISNYDHVVKALSEYINDNITASATAFGEVNDKISIDSTTYNEAYKFLKNKLEMMVPDSFFQTGEEAYRSGDYETAITNYKECLDADPTYVQAVYRMAWAYYNMGDTENSHKYFKKIVSDFPDSEYYQEAKGYVGEVATSADAAIGEGETTTPATTETTTPVVE